MKMVSENKLRQLFEIAYDTAFKRALESKIDNGLENCPTLTEADRDWTISTLIDDCHPIDTLSSDVVNLSDSA